MFSFHKQRFKNDKPFLRFSSLPIPDEILKKRKNLWRLKWIRTIYIVPVTIFATAITIVSGYFGYYQFIHDNTVDIAHHGHREPLWFDQAKIYPDPNRKPESKIEEYAPENLFVDVDTGKVVNHRAEYSMMGHIYHKPGAEKENDQGPGFVKDQQR